MSVWGLDLMISKAFSNLDGSVILRTRKIGNNCTVGKVTMHRGSSSSSPSPLALLLSPVPVLSHALSLLPSRALIKAHI